MSTKQEQKRKEIYKLIKSYYQFTTYIKLANDIKREIESTITFPGTINVNIIRESRFNVEASKENVMEYND